MVGVVFVLVVPGVGCGAGVTPVAGEVEDHVVVVGVARLLYEGLVQPLAADLDVVGMFHLAGGDHGQTPHKTTWRRTHTRNSEKGRAYHCDVGVRVPVAENRGGDRNLRTATR